MIFLILKNMFKLLNYFMRFGIIYFNFSAIACRENVYMSINQEKRLGMKYESKKLIVFVNFLKILTNKMIFYIKNII